MNKLCYLLHKRFWWTVIKWNCGIKDFIASMHFCLLFIFPFQATVLTPHTVILSNRNSNFYFIVAVNTCIKLSHFYDLFSCNTQISEMMCIIIIKLIISVLQECDSKSYFYPPTIRNQELWDATLLHVFFNNAKLRILLDIYFINATFIYLTLYGKYNIFSVVFLFLKTLHFVLETGLKGNFTSYLHVFVCI